MQKHVMLILKEKFTQLLEHLKEKVMQINNMTDRELLEQIYRLLLEISEKVKEIDNDDKQLSMNILANLIADGLIKDK